MRHLALTLCLVALITALPADAIRGTTAHAWQTAAPSSADETFDVVSIKRADPDASRGYSERSGGRIESLGQNMVPMIARAFGVRVTQVIGGPDWMRQDLYTIRTTAAGNPDSAHVNQMLRHMLANRFKLVAHMDKRELPVYVLTVARPGRLGPNLKARVPPCEPGKPPAPESVPAGMPPVCGPGRVGGQVLQAIGITMPTLARMMTDFWFNAPVADKTGLEGQFDVSLTNFVNQWTDDPLKAEASDPNAARLPVAMEEQLGLKLELRRESQDVVVIDRLERPTED